MIQAEIAVARAGSRVIPRILESVLGCKPADQTGRHPPVPRRFETAEVFGRYMEARGPSRHESSQTEPTTSRLLAPPPLHTHSTAGSCAREKRAPRPVVPPALERTFVGGGGGLAGKPKTLATEACEPKLRPENTWKPSEPTNECKSTTSRTLSGNLRRGYCTASRGLQLQPARRTARTRRAPHGRNASRSKTRTPYWTLSRSSIMLVGRSG